MIDRRNAGGALCAALTVAGALWMTGCNGSDFNDGKAQTILENNSIHLDGEEVQLTQDQLNCAVENDLFETPSQASSNRYVARITQKGRDLKFTDDVSIGEFPQPAAQIRGDFNLQVTNFGSTHDPADGTKLVEVRALVKISHPCFGAGLPLMGVKKGAFSQDTLARAEFGFTQNGWQFDKIVH